MSIPTKQDFATEVRADRLGTLWQVTLLLCIIAFWIVATLMTLQRSSTAEWLVALMAVGVGCVLTRTFLKHNRYALAVWAYALGAVVAGTIILLFGQQHATQIAPFIFPMLVFVIGLLLPPSHTFLMSLMASIIIVVASSLNPVATAFGPHQIIAIFLTWLSALLAAQVTGELYQVTEWALLNYQRERKTTEALFENRQLLERSLLRSQALSEELQETNAQLDAARVAAEEAKHFRGQFLANMSHELRTPLNAIIGFSETMLKFPQMYDNVGLPKSYESDLSQIYSSGRQLLSLINDILDLSKVDAGKLEVNMQRVELEPIVHNILATAEGLIGSKPVKLETDLPEKMPVVWADESRVQQVLLNLYSNACKFTDKGTIKLAIREADDTVRFSLSDSGPGIDKRFHEAIFEEFKQANAIGRDPRSGAGLGLAISRHLLGLMGGYIWVESELGKGSTFHFVVSSYRDDSTRPRRSQITGEIPKVEVKPDAAPQTEAEQQEKVV
ncbi:MAG: two-component sensor histidine kinase [Anaerolineae bacterium]|nr:two-component sensor histidine kinase [Anaerolineae bacterium]